MALMDSKMRMLMFFGFLSNPTKFNIVYHLLVEGHGQPVDNKSLFRWLQPLSERTYFKNLRELKQAGIVTKYPNYTKDSFRGRVTVAHYEVQNPYKSALTILFSLIEPSPSTQPISNEAKSIT